MNFGMIILNKNIKIMQIYAIWILAALSIKTEKKILKQKIFTKILQVVLKNRLTHQAIVKMIIDPLSRGMNKTKKRFFTDELEGKVMKKFVALRPKTYSYLLFHDDDVDDSEHKKANVTKISVI